MQTDLLIKNAQVYNTTFKKFFLANVLIKGNRFFHIAKDYNPNAQEVIDVQGAYMIPGLIDIHMHIESSMITPSSFSQAAIKNGVTTVVSEPHEIANVFGLEGVTAMINAAENCTCDIFYGIPSSVPSTDEALETTGGSITIPDIDLLLKEKRILCLGEVMNYRKVGVDPNASINKLLEHLRNVAPSLILEGHCPKLTGEDLSRFIYAGVDSDHTEHNYEELYDRFYSGMFVEIQDKMLLPWVIDLLKTNNLFEQCALVTDDVMADTFVSKGHLNALVKKAISLGLRPEDAIYCATHTPARRMNLKDRGSISPGRLADFILISNLEDFDIKAVYKNGRKAYDKLLPNVALTDNFTFPKHFYQSIHLNKVSPKDFMIKVASESDSVICRIMDVRDKSTFTSEIHDSLNVTADGYLDVENSPYALAAVFERHGKNYSVGFGLVSGDIITQGAVASTYAHDHHNLLVLGRNINDMVLAANKVIEMQGGYAIYNNGELLAELALPIAGILSDASVEEVGDNLAQVRAKLKELGYNHYNSIMSLGTLSLIVSPDIKLSNKGLIDVSSGTILSLFVK